MNRTAPPEVRVLGSADDAVPIVLDEFRRVVGSPKPLIGLATGDTYGEAWRILGEELRTRRLSSDFLLTHLGEYVGFGPDRPGGIVHELVRQCPPMGDMLRSGDFLPVPHESDGDAIAAHERRIVRAGGLTLQFLGIGRNGHIAFNEPGSSVERGFHVADLAETTRTDARARFAPEEPPRQAVTLGIASILGVRRLVLCAFGSAKAPAVAAMLQGEIDPSCPASAIRRHANALVLLDREAARDLANGAAAGGA